MTGLAALLGGPPGPFLGGAAALACALAWTCLSLVARSLAPHLNALSINMVRSAVGGALLTLVALASGGFGGLAEVSLRSWVYLTLSILTAIAVGDTAFFESARTIGMARAMTVSTLYPVIAAALALAFFDERITPAVAAGTLVTLGGLGLIVSERSPVAEDAGGERARGLTLALVAAASWGVSAALMKPPLSEIDPVTIQAVRLPLAAVALWLTPWARGAVGRVRGRLATLGPSILLLGVLTAVSSVTFLFGLKHAGVALGTVLSATSPLFALPIGYLAFGERVTWRATTGALLAIAGIALLGL